MLLKIYKLAWRSSCLPSGQSNRRFQLSPNNATRCCNHQRSVHNQRRIWKSQQHRHHLSQQDGIDLLHFCIQGHLSEQSWPFFAQFEAQEGLKILYRCVSSVLCTQEYMLQGLGHHSGCHSLVSQMFFWWNIFL